MPDPAAPSEADRGGSLRGGPPRAAATSERGRDRGRGRGRLPGRRHHRVPARAERRVLLPRDEHAAPSRAPGDRAGVRRGHRARAATGRPRPAVARPRRRAPAPRPRPRVPHHRRRPVQQLPPGDRRDPVPPDAVRPRGALGWGDRGGQRSDAVLRPVARQAPRVGRHPGDGIATDAARAARARDRGHPVVPGLPSARHGGPRFPARRLRHHVSRARGLAPARYGRATRADPAARRRRRAARRAAARGGAIAATDGTAARPAVRLDPRRAPGGARRVSEVVTITGIATGGDGVGRLADGRAVFVPRAAPGEGIRVRGGGRAVGFHPYDQPGRIFPLADCHITDFRLMALWRDLKPRLDLLPAGLTRLTLRLDREGRRHILAESAGEPWLDAERLRAALPPGDPVICWWQPVDGAARVMAGPATGFPATAFEQVHPEMALLARRWAVEQLGDLRGGVALGLYGGIGDTAVELAARGAQVASVDVDETAVEWARGRASERPIRFIAGGGEDVLATLPEPNAVVVTPPRDGLHWNVTLRLPHPPVAHVAYLSSDPATLARHLHRLSVNYRIAAARAFDLFPQTAQVETVVVLEAA